MRAVLEDAKVLIVQVQVWDCCGHPKICGLSLIFLAIKDNFSKLRIKATISNTSVITLDADADGLRSETLTPRFFFPMLEFPIGLSAPEITLGVDAPPFCPVGFLNDSVALLDVDEPKLPTDGSRAPIPACGRALYY